MLWNGIACAILATAMIHEFTLKDISLKVAYSRPNSLATKSIIQLHYSKKWIKPELEHGVQCIFLENLTLMSEIKFHFCVSLNLVQNWHWFK